MKIIDIISDTKLFEMAYERKKARELVNDQSDNIVSHLLKLFVINSPNDRTHWISEINGWLRQIKKIKLKPNSKRPSKQDLYNWLLVDNVPTYDKEYVLDEIAIWKYDNYKNSEFFDIDEEFVINKIKLILEKVVEDISTNKFLGIQDYL